MPDDTTHPKMSPNKPLTLDDIPKQGQQGQQGQGQGQGKPQGK